MTTPAACQPTIDRTTWIDLRGGRWLSLTVRWTYRSHGSRGIDRARNAVQRAGGASWKPPALSLWGLVIGSWVWFDRFGGPRDCVRLASSRIPSLQINGVSVHGEPHLHPRRGRCSGRGCLRRPRAGGAEGKAARRTAEDEAAGILEAAGAEADNLRRAAELRGKEEGYRLLKQELLEEAEQRRAELEKTEKRLSEKEESRTQAGYTCVDQRQEQVAQREGKKRRVIGVERS